MNSFLIIGSTQNTTYGTILFVSLSFLLLLVLIKHFAWDSIANMMNERAQKISDDIDQAEQARISAVELASQRERELRQSRLEASAIITNAEKTAEQNSQDIVKQGHEMVVQMKEQSEKDILAQQAKAYAELKQDVAALSIEIATKVLQKELDDQAHASLIDACIEGLEQTYEA